MPSFKIIQYQKGGHNTEKAGCVQDFPVYLRQNYTYRTIGEIPALQNLLEVILVSPGFHIMSYSFLRINRLTDSRGLKIKKKKKSILILQINRNGRAHILTVWRQRIVETV